MKLDLPSDVKISVDLVRDFKRDVQQVLEAEVRGKRGVGGAGGAGGAGGRGRTIKPEVEDGGGLGLCVHVLTARGGRGGDEDGDGNGANWRGTV